MNTLQRFLALAAIVALPLLAVSPARAQGAIIVDIATDATDPLNFDDSEPSIAVNPANPLEIAVVGFADGYGGGTLGSIWKSLDGGATWIKKFIITSPPNNEVGPFDQKLAYGRTGNLFYVGLGFDQIGNIVNRVWHQTGTPDDPLALGGTFGDDQPHLEVDKSGGVFNDRVYSPFLSFSVAPTRSTVAWSSNLGGLMTPVAVGDNSQFPNRTTRIAVGPNGRVFVIYKTREGAVQGGFQDSKFHVTRSDDGGLTWNANNGGTAGGKVISGPTAVPTWFSNSFGNPAKGPVARARSSDAWICANQSNGDVWAAYCVKDNSGFGQVYAARSTDSGVTWQSFRVSDGTRHAAFPEIACTDTGTPGVLYVDYDDSGAKTIFNHHFARSFDNGATWTDEVLHSMDASLASNAANGFLWGDYEGVTAVGNTFYGVFTGNSIGRSAIQFDPIFFKQTGLPPFMTLSIAPSKVAPGDSAVGTVTLVDGAVGDQTIALSSNNANVTVPASVVIPGGQKSATFAVDTSPSINAAITATITAQNQGKQAQAFITVQPFIKGVEFYDAYVTGKWLPALDVPFGGDIILARVVLSDVAQEGGVVVDLTSTDPNAATVQPSVTVQGGRDRQEFYVFSNPVATTDTLQIQATSKSTVSGTLVIHAPVPSQLLLVPQTVTGGNTATGVVYVNSVAPPTGLPIQLASDNPAAASVAPSVTVAPGKTYASFPITTVAVASTKTATIKATNEGVSASARLTIAPAAGASLGSLVFNPAAVPGGAQLRGTVTLTRPAPTGGATISLGKTDPGSILGALPVVYVPAGYQLMSFYIPTRVVTQDTSATVTATYGGGAKSATVTVRAPFLVSVTALPTRIRSGTTAAGRVFLSGPPLQAVTVKLTYTAGASGPTAVVVPAGQSVAMFTITGGPVSKTTNVTITGEYPTGTFASAPLIITP